MHDASKVWKHYENSSLIEWQLQLAHACPITCTAVRLILTPASRGKEKLLPEFVTAQTSIFDWQVRPLAGQTRPISLISPMVFPDFVSTRLGFVSKDLSFSSLFQGSLGLVSQTGNSCAPSIRWRKLDVLPGLENKNASDSPLSVKDHVVPLNKHITKGVSLNAMGLVWLFHLQPSPPFVSYQNAMFRSLTTFIANRLTLWRVPIFQLSIEHIK